MPNYKNLYETCKQYLSAPLTKPISNEPTDDIATVKERQIALLNRHEWGYSMLAGLIAVVVIYLFANKPSDSPSYWEVFQVNAFTRVTSAALLLGFFFCFYRARKMQVAIQQVHDAKLSTYPYEQKFVLPLRNRNIVLICVAVEILESEKNEQNLARLMVGSNIALARYLLDRDILPVPQEIDDLLSKSFAEKYKELGLSFLRATTIDVNFQKPNNNDFPVAII